mmetsp:Transcript_2850/g.4295  ORF Transcript_2850/g.4295 Transcript_2850/m.4295 type:complete len:897 (+) Transcript_2850:223-2913(+)
MKSSSPIGLNGNEETRTRSRGLRSNKAGDYGGHGNGSHNDSAPTTPNDNEDKSDEITSSNQQNVDGKHQSSGRPSRRNRSKQVDQNYVDSGKVFQKLRQQSLKTNLSFDIESNILARIDHDSYKDAMLKDADSILHTFLLPMAIPWSEHHPYSNLVRNFPKDIDEMPEVQGMDDHSHIPFENGTFGYGKFEIGKSPKSVSPEFLNGVRAASRRSNDPGVIELATIDFDNLGAASAKISRNHFVNNTSPEKKISNLSQSARRSSRKRKCANPPSEQTTSHPMLDYFQQQKTQKKAKLEIAAKSIEKKFISVRFGSTSSRSSIFYDHEITDQDSNSVKDDDASVETAPRPLLVKVNLPLEVQAGRSLKNANAAKSAEMLGSYDMRFGMSKEMLPSSASKARRTTTGRTRLLWTKAFSGGTCSSDSISSRHRLAYSSILTGNRVDIASFRRPRDVTLAVKLNGKLLSTLQPTPGMENHSGDDNANVAAISGISQKVISDAISAATKSTRTRRKDISIATSQIKSKAMCFLECDEFLQKLLKKKKAETAAIKRSGKKEPFSAGAHAISTSGNTFEFSLPTLDCLPSTDGVVRVACTVSGDLKSLLVPSVLNLDSKDNGIQCCSVCFSSNSDQPVERCGSCGVNVHLNCCFDKGFRPTNGESWLCSSCSNSNNSINSSTRPESQKLRRRKSKTPFRFRSDDETDRDADTKEGTKEESVQRCQLCPHSGGAMSPSPTGDGHIHEVCRVWTSYMTDIPQNGILDMVSRNPLLNRLRTLCAICGKRMHDFNGKCEGELVKCATSGCQVYFHPMCGLLASKIAASETKGALTIGLERRDVLDTQLCNQYTLTMLKCSIKGDIQDTKITPVVFCGFHNPNRETSLYGCYPCGGLIGDSMRIPSHRI